MGGIICRLVGGEGASGIQEAIVELYCGVFTRHMGFRCGECVSGECERAVLWGCGDDRPCGLFEECGLLAAGQVEWSIPGDMARNKGHPELPVPSHNFGE